jgi:hypothetical protein
VVGIVCTVVIVGAFVVDGPYFLNICAGVGLIGGSTAVFDFVSIGKIRVIAHGNTRDGCNDWAISEPLLR